MNGSFKIPSPDGNYVDVFALPDADSIQDRFTSEVDLKPIARKLFRTTLDKQRSNHVLRETQVTSKMFESLERFSPDIQTNIILDRAYNSPNESADLALEGISKQVRREIKNKTIGTSARDVVNSLKKYANRVTLAMSERISDARRK